MEYFLTAVERGDLDLDKYCAGERRVLWCCNRHKNEIEHNRVVLIEACSIRSVQFCLHVERRPQNPDGTNGGHVCAPRMRECNVFAHIGWIKYYSLRIPQIRETPPQRLG